MRTLIARVAVMLATLYYAHTTAADIVQLDNGDRLTGTVSNITNGVVTLSTAYAGDVAIAMANVTQIETDGDYDVTLATGDQVSGRLVADGLQVGDNLIGSELNSIRFLEQIPTGEPVFTSRVDGLFSLSNGNSNTQALNIFADTFYSHGNNEHRLGIAWSDEEAESQTTKAQIEIDYGYRRLLRDDWYFGGNFEYFRDELKDINRRITVGATVGKQFWNTPVSRFSVELGISAVLENLDGSTENNPALRWGLDYTRQLAANAQFFHNHEILAVLGGGRGQIFDTSTGVRYALSDRLNVNFRVDYRNETDPPEGNSSSDVTYGIGVGYILF